MYGKKIKKAFPFEINRESLLIILLGNINELNDIITACYYSVLYYNADIWLIPSLSPALKQKLLSASAKAIKLCLTKLPQNTSFETIHRLAKRATPTQMSTYKHAIQL